MPISGLFKRRSRSGGGGGGGNKGRAPAIGMYGKLESEGDFVRWGAANSAEVKALDDWLSTALTYAARNVDGWDATFDHAPTAGFCLRGADGQQALVGALTPSRDHIGRRFPLLVFSEVDESTAAARYQGLPYLSFVRDARAVLSHRDRLTRDTLVAAMQRMHPPGDAEFAAACAEHDAYVARSDCASAFAAIFGLSHVVQQGRALAALRRSLASLGPQDRRGRWGVRAPSGAHAADGVALWLALAQRYTSLALLPNVLFTDQALVLFPGEMSQKALVALWRPELADDSICDLATTDTEGPELEPHTPLSTVFAL